MRYRRLFTWLSLGLWVAAALLGQYGETTHAEGDRVRYVSPVGRDKGNCKSDKSPCRTVQFALNAARDEETKIAAGTYTGAGNQVLLIDRGVTIMGGFAPPDWEQGSSDTHPTVLDAQGKRRVVHIRRDTAVTLDRLQIVNGAVVGDHGGGIYVEPSGVTLYHLIRFSPAIDRAAGAGDGVSSDIDGQPRPIGPGYDLGADEFNQVDLSLSYKRVRPQTAQVGDRVTYSIVLRNVGTVDAYNAVMLDPFSDQTSYVPSSAYATAGTVTDGAAIEWKGTVVAGGAVTISFQAVVNAPGMVRNQATVVGTYGTTHTVTAWLNGQEVYLPLIFSNCCP